MDASVLRLRPLRPSDVGAVLGLQAQCYGPALIEDGAAFEAKLRATETLGTCWLAERDRQALAYVLSLPVCEQSFPALNAAEFRPSAAPSLLYLHDLAVAPAGRALGLGRRLFERVLQAAQDLALDQIGLVAVQDSLAFWRRQGFAEPGPLPAGIAAKLASFGADARYLARPSR
ncbi:GNAT family N-acetyltransferase [Roseateles violae]|uniref:GNAT family N-acetyltransferase n=1 Tax=Roseateles violae TaxID=3058042 RepID=A0ABT8DP94_9BURK|nr:GNAT family N-acetyltransferase [Pelomonas sp. PFR6]MDN3920155.1 GNAT family N-acetyltransferase [Pelomonas sp. PFR6]